MKAKKRTSRTMLVRLSPKGPIVSFAGGKRPPSPETDRFAAAFFTVTNSMLRDLDTTDPAAINRGSCDEWANKMQELVGGQAVWLDSILDADEFPIDKQPRIDHCVLALDGRYYDSEHPAGVDHVLILAGFNSNDARKFNGKITLLGW